MRAVAILKIRPVCAVASAEVLGSWVLVQAAGVHASLGEVYEDLAHENECCVCLENERTMVFSPCGHLVSPLQASSLVFFMRSVQIKRQSFHTVALALSPCFCPFRDL